MKTKQLIIYIFLLLSVITLKAEDDKLQAANWIFGNNCWLDFSSGIPVSKDDAKINTTEGVATISDKEGNLLFYTDGTTVRNKNHKVMENGRDLYGSFSSAQSGVIIPAPDNSNLFYLFTVDELYNANNYNHIHPNHHGFNYSLVDISKNNGLGKVIKKNINLFAFTCEKITAIGHSTKDAYWVIAQEWGTNIIYVYLIDREGIHFDHKYTSHIFSNYNNPANTKGYLKFSADGTRLASANNGIGLALYDFNAKTGKISNEILLKNSYFKNSYGIEFSPSGKYLYLSSMPFQGIPSNNANAYIVQIDISLSNVPDIANSSIVLLEESDKRKWWMGALQIAIDGKIYLSIMNLNSFSYRRYLSAIEFPEKKGEACNFILKAINLDYGDVMIGLPSMIQSFYVPMTVNVTHQVCVGGVIVLDAEYIEGTTYNWKGPNGFSADTCYVEILNATKNMEGIYTVSAIHKDSKDTVFIEKEIVIQDTDIKVTFNNSEAEFSTNDNVEKIISIQNMTDFETIINNIYLKGNNGDYSTKNITYPIIIGPKQTVGGIKIDITTDKHTILKDSLVIETSNPCPKTFDFLLEDVVTKEICEGDDLILSVCYLDAESYQWTGPNNFISNSCDTIIRNITMNMAGTYILTVQLKNNEKLTIYKQKIIVRNTDIKVSFDNSLDDFQTGNAVEKTMTIENLSDFQVSISNVYLKDDDGDYTINNANFPIYINPHKSSNKITIKLNTSVGSLIEDSISVEVASPCPKKYDFLLRDNIIYVVCEGEDIILKADYVEGSKYKWEGPNGFSVDTYYHVIENATRDMEGIYTLSYQYKDEEKLTKIENQVIVNYIDLHITVKNTKDNFRYNDIVEKIISIENLGHEEVKIENIFLKLNTGDYKLDNISFPIIIQANDVYDNIKLNITTNKNSYLEDSLLIDVVSYCPKKYELLLQDKIQKEPIYFYLSDTTVPLGKFLRYNIYANAEKDISSHKFDVFIKIKHLVDFYNIYKSPTLPYEKSYNGDTIFTSFTLKDIQFSTIKKRIRTLTGTTLLGDIKFTPVIFDSIDLNNNFYQAILHKGSISSNEEICNEDLLQTSYYNRHLAYSIENPNTSGNIVLSSPDKGNLKLEVLSYTGKLVFETTFYSDNNEFNKTVKIPDLETGVYVIIWKSEQKSYRTKIQFNR